MEVPSIDDMVALMLIGTYNLHGIQICWNNDSVTKSSLCISYTINVMLDSKKVETEIALAHSCGPYRRTIKSRMIARMKALEKLNVHKVITDNIVYRVGQIGVNFDVGIIFWMALVIISFRPLPFNPIFVIYIFFTEFIS